MIKMLVFVKIALYDVLAPQAIESGGQARVLLLGCAHTRVYSGLRSNPSKI